MWWILKTRAERDVPYATGAFSQGPQTRKMGKSYPTPKGKTMKDG